MIINKENYSEFIKDERELEFVLGMEEETERVNQVMSALKKYLEIKQTTGSIETFSTEENRFEIVTSRYNIYLLVLHNGDVCQYTINKKIKKPANYSRRMYFESVLDTLNKFIQ
ncbi:hypothetical protein PGC35_15760 [Psychrobacillus sp. PGGUH221]|uniref:hypothetical protein n=1 Tax=Psychrobacillus sp. PGGUH221 TaxID=3020058 RepID=UPI0035C67E3B